MSIISKFNSPYFLENLKNHEIFRDGESIAIEPGPFLPTIDELEWLHSFLMTDIASTLLSNSTKGKLEILLREIPTFDMDTFIQVKQMPKPEGSTAPFLQVLKLCIRNQHGSMMTYTTKAGYTFTEEGFPVEFVYNIAKKRWYIKWLNLQKMIMMTPLDRLENVVESEMDVSDYHMEIKKLKEEKLVPKIAVIKWTPKYPNMDVHRFLHAFSAFRINMQDTDNVTLDIYYMEEEEQFLLSKIRQFGPHVLILSPPSLQKAMVETARRALENYQ